jgi:hypothetical protein
MGHHSRSHTPRGARLTRCLVSLTLLAVLALGVVAFWPGREAPAAARSFAIAGDYTFIGGVYQGFGGSAPTPPLPGVKIDLYGDMDDEPDGGAFTRLLLATATTDDEGKFTLTTSGEVQSYTWFYLVKSDYPGTYDTARITNPPAEPVSGKPSSWVGYHNVAPGEYGVTRWWVWWDGVPTPTDPPPVTKTPSFTPTATETDLPLTGAPTATPTATDTATSVTSTATPTSTPTETATASASATGAATPSATQRPAGTATQTATRWPYRPFLPIIMK